MLHFLRWLFVLTAGLGMLSCATTGRSGSGTAPEASKALRDAVEQWFEEHLRLNPFVATYIGDNRYDDLFPNPASAAHEEGTRRNWEKARAAVLAVDPAALSDRDRLTRDIFLFDAELALEGLRFPYRLLPMNQMDNLVLELARFGSGAGPQPFQTRAQHEAWLRRARGFPAWVDDAIRNMREGQAKGITHPRVAMEAVLKQVDSLTQDKPEQSLFWRPLERLDEKERARLEPEYRKVFGNEVMPALVKLRNFIRDEHLPKCRTTVGWSALPNGDDWYAWHVKFSTTTGLSPEEIHAMGTKEVARILAEMDGVRQKVGFQGPLPDFFTWARTDPRFYFDNPEDLLQGFRDLKSRIDAELPKLFSLFPKAEYEVRAVEAFRAQSAPGGAYQQPSGDGSRPGIFYVNTFNLKAQPKYGMQTLSLHEAAPGHHFQIALQQELPLPRFRRFGGYNASIEGWALYAETLGPQLGLYTEPMDYYGHLSDQQFRAMRLVVDTGLHTKGWTREQAIRFMLENSSMAESDVTAEVDRYMVWPGQALGYKVGQLRILEMRTRAEEQLGPKFDLKAFHGAMLDDGSLPLGFLEKKVETLIDKSR